MKHSDLWSPSSFLRKREKKEGNSYRYSVDITHTACYMAKMSYSTMSLTIPFSDMPTCYRGAFLLQYRALDNKSGKRKTSTTVLVLELETGAIISSRYYVKSGPCLEPK